LCDDKGPTITIFKSKANRIFGGFTQESWDSKSSWKIDEKAFIFSMDRKQIYRVVNANLAICCVDFWGPNFGGNTLGLHGNLLNLEDGGSSYIDGDIFGDIYGIKSDS
jgi:hypothetical protein